jgi:hypothetical protein
MWLSVVKEWVHVSGKRRGGGELDDRDRRRGGKGGGVLGWSVLSHLLNFTNSGHGTFNGGGGVVAVCSESIRKLRRHKPVPDQARPGGEKGIHNQPAKVGGIPLLQPQGAPVSAMVG